MIVYVPILIPFSYQAALHNAWWCVKVKVASDWVRPRYIEVLGTCYFLFNCRNLPMYNSYVKVAGETTPIGGKHREPLLHESCFQKKILCLLNSTQLYSRHTWSGTIFREGGTWWDMNLVEDSQRPKRPPWTASPVSMKERWQSHLGSIYLSAEMPFQADSFSMKFWYGF